MKISLLFLVLLLTYPAVSQLDNRFQYNIKGEVKSITTHIYGSTEMKVGEEMHWVSNGELNRKIYQEFNEDGDVVKWIYFEPSGDTSFVQVSEYLPSGKVVRKVFGGGELQSESVYHLPGTVKDDTRMLKVTEEDIESTVWVYYNQEGRIRLVNSFDPNDNKVFSGESEFDENGNLMKHQMIFSGDTLTSRYEFLAYTPGGNWLMAAEFSDQDYRPVINLRQFEYFNGYEPKAIKPGHGTPEELITLIKEQAAKNDVKAFEEVIMPDLREKYNTELGKGEFTAEDTFVFFAEIELAGKIRYTDEDTAHVPVTSFSETFVLNFKRQRRKWYLVIE